MLQRLPKKAAFDKAVADADTQFAADKAANDADAATALAAWHAANKAAADAAAAAAAAAKADADTDAAEKKAFFDKKKADTAAANVKKAADISDAAAEAATRQKAAADQKAADIAAAKAAASAAVDKQIADKAAALAAQNADDAQKHQNYEAAAKAASDQAASSRAAATALNAQAKADYETERARRKADDAARWTAQKAGAAAQEKSRADEQATRNAAKATAMAAAAARRQANRAHGRGDPHMMNINGDKFNIVQEGRVPLIKIPKEGAPHLSVEGVVVRAAERKCQKQIFFTEATIGGNWLEKDVVVQVGDETEEGALKVNVDGQQVWSPALEGQAVLFSHATGKFSITKMKNKDTPGVKLHLANEPNVLIEIQRPMFRPNTRAHLNLNLAGLEDLANSWSVGGILGTDDHTAWSTETEDCKNLMKVDEAQEFVGSFASASRALH